jgi:hypothetical protein
VAGISQPSFKDTKTLTQFNIAIVPPPSGPICDFCSYPEAFAPHSCDDFTHEKFTTRSTDINSTSTGSWAACRTCDELIRSEQWQQLLDRSVGRFVELFGFEPPGLRDYLRRIHNLFRQFRRAPC